jgi:hypothetical protein
MRLSWSVGVVCGALAYHADLLSFTLLACSAASPLHCTGVRLIVHLLLLHSSLPQVATSTSAVAVPIALSVRSVCTTFAFIK